MVPNTQTLWLNDPQSCADWLRAEGANRTLKAVQDGDDGLIVWPQDYDTGRTAWVVATGIRAAPLRDTEIARGIVMRDFAIECDVQALEREILEIVNARI